jgi:hypothetical protein
MRIRIDLPPLAISVSIYNSDIVATDVSPVGIHCFGIVGNGSRAIVAVKVFQEHNVAFMISINNAESGFHA